MDLTNWWRLVYWLQFMLSFLILPIFVEFEMLDHMQNLIQRIKASLYSVMKVYLLYAIVGGVAYVAWSLLATGMSISFSQLGMTIAVVWGLIQISVLMGYGLVLLPQSFQEKDIEYLYEIALCQVDDFEI